MANADIGPNFIQFQPFGLLILRTSITACHPCWIRGGYLHLAMGTSPRRDDVSHEMKGCRWPKDDDGSNPQYIRTGGLCVNRDIGISLSSLRSAKR